MEIKAQNDLTDKSLLREEIYNLRVVYENH